MEFNIPKWIGLSRRGWFDSWVRNIPWRRGRLPASVFMAQMVKCLPAMQETWVQSLGWEDPLEEGMATYSSILAWGIRKDREPGGLESMGSQRVGHD